MSEEPPDDEARFNAVIEEYGAILRRAIARFCPRHLGLHHDDLEQEARLRLWTALRRERPIQDLASYIYRVAATATIDAVRRIKARRGDRTASLDAEGDAGAPSSATAEGPEAGLDRQRLLAKVEGVLERMEARRATVVRLHFQGFTTVEIARMLATTEPAARNLLHRALKEMRHHLEDEGLAYAGE